MKRRSIRRNRLLFGLALVCLALVAICLLPALLAGFIAAPKVMGGLAMAFPVGLLVGKKGEDDDMAEVLERTAGALNALDQRTKQQGGELTTLKGELDEIRQATNAVHLNQNEIRRAGILRASTSPTAGMHGLSDECCRELAAVFVNHCARSGKLEMLASDRRDQDALLAEAKSVTKALTTTEIALPTNYGSEISMLTAQHGVVRKHMTMYPIGHGTAKPPRTKTLPAFGSIAMSAPFPEKKPAIDFASLESHKVGGLSIVPREINEQSLVAMGRFLALYAAYEFARCEDDWGFLADGGDDYESVKGVVKVCTDNDKLVTLNATKTKPSDATLADFRALRTIVSTGALSDGKYFLHHTLETFLRNFNTALDTCFVYRNDGTATLDGFPIVWTNVLQPYSTAAAAGKCIAAFGSLRWWWFGEHGTPRIDTSEHVYFANDQLAVRFIEEIDFDYASLEAMAVLKTAAA